MEDDKRGASRRPATIPATAARAKTHPGPPAGMPWLQATEIVTPDSSAITSKDVETMLCMRSSLK
ncbi:hypothetical protein D3C78_1574350 [compost metagenome]